MREVGNEKWANMALKGYKGVKIGGRKIRIENAIYSKEILWKGCNEVRIISIIRLNNSKCIRSMRTNLQEQ